MECSLQPTRQSPVPQIPNPSIQTQNRIPFRLQRKNEWNKSKHQYHNEGPNLETTLYLPKQFRSSFGPRLWRRSNETRKIVNTIHRTIVASTSHIIPFNTDPYITLSKRKPIHHPSHQYLCTIPKQQTNKQTNQPTNKKTNRKREKERERRRKMGVENGIPYFFSGHMNRSDISNRRFFPFPIYALSTEEDLFSTLFRFTNHRRKRNGLVVFAWRSILSRVCVQGVGEDETSGRKVEGEWKWSGLSVKGKKLRCTNDTFDYDFIMKHSHQGREKKKRGNRGAIWYMCWLLTSGRIAASREQSKVLLHKGRKREKIGVFFWKKKKYMNQERQHKRRSTNLFTGSDRMEPFG